MRRIQLGMSELGPLGEQAPCLLEPALLSSDHAIGQVGVYQRLARMSARMLEELTGVGISPSEIALDELGDRQTEFHRESQVAPVELNTQVTCAQVPLFDLRGVAADCTEGRGKLQGKLELQPPVIVVVGQLGESVDGRFEQLGSFHLRATVNRSVSSAFASRYRLTRRTGACVVFGEYFVCHH